MAENLNEGVHGALSVDDYIKPTDPDVLEKLEWFQDQKLALMSHWGLYSQLGFMESWSLSDGDADWAWSAVDWHEEDTVAFKKDYYSLSKSFNPVRFQPEKWAEAAAVGGFKYYIFTTKHHDGYCMWDTKYTDYKVTGPNSPFRENPRADIAKHVFNAFRDKGIGIAAYFSKADWHVPSYWEKERGEVGYREDFTRRGPSYLPEEKPELWEEFVQFTHNQIMELVEDYGPLDILWFDAGWVTPRAIGQDIRIEELIDKARKVQPGIISADRTCGGSCENYITPEQSIPSRPLAVPWESCISMGQGFAYSYDDEYKSTQTLLRMLIDIVAKGGNLALNVAPQTDGRFPEPALVRMREMGAWLKQYGDAIYGTRICAPYRVGDYAFTQKAKEGKVFAFYFGEFADTLEIPYKEKDVLAVKNMTTGVAIPFEIKDGNVVIKLTEMAATDSYGGEPIAEVFEFKV